MNDLIEALHIFKKYVDGEWRNPFYCSYEELCIMQVDPDDVSKEDIARLDELGFFVSSEDCFMSFRFGSG